jgi:hypothetical protein
MKILLQIAALGLVLTANAQGTSEAVLNYSSSTVGNFNGTAGWSFEPVNSLSVTGLGVFTYVIMNQGDVQVGLWKANGTLIASNTITATSGTYNQSSYESIAPVLLMPGQVYHLGVYVPATGSVLLNVVAPDLGTVNISPDVHLRSSAVSTGPGFVFPPEMAPPDGAILLGPNFRYNFVPEPSSFALLCLGAFAVTLFRNKKRD